MSCSQCSYDANQCHDSARSGPLPRLLNYRKPLILLSQAALITLSYVCSFLLRFDLRLEAQERLLIMQTLGLVLMVKLLTFYFFGLLRGWWRYVGLSDAL